MKTAKRKWPLVAGAVAALLLLMITALLAGGILKVKTKYGTIVLENLPADAEVVVDGETVTLKAGDGKPIEISVAAGKKHQLQVNKEGFKVFGKELEIEPARPICRSIAAGRVICVLRGGSWNNNPRNCRAANRNRNAPSNRNNTNGFRVAFRLHSRHREAANPEPAGSWAYRAWCRKS
jgi:hypothetical protein